MKFRFLLPLAALALAMTGSAFAQYSHDDGTADVSVGLTSGGTLTWANEFSVQAGYDVITSIEMVWYRPIGDGTMVPDGTPVLVQLWSDPNGDGDPLDAVLLSSVAGVTQNLGNTFVSYDIPDVALPVASRFFVGATLTHVAGEFPMSQDTTPPDQLRSWVSVGATLPGAGRITDFGLPGNWMIRATAVPEPGTIAAVITGLSGMLALRRRRA